MPPVIMRLARRNALIVRSNPMINRPKWSEGSRRAGVVRLDGPGRQVEPATAALAERFVDGVPMTGSVLQGGEE
jgi:hypothetical protein